MSNQVNEDVEFQSPTKSIYNIFKRSSFESYESNESGSHSNRRSLSPVRKSISNSLTGSTTPSSKRISKSPSRFRTIMPIFSNRNSIQSRPEITNPFIADNEKPAQEPTSIKDFADTSSEDGSLNEGRTYDDYDIESVESILQEYSDEKKKLFLFQEHFDESTVMSTKRKSGKSLLERTIYSDGSDSKRSSAGSDFQIYEDEDDKSNRNSLIASGDALRTNQSSSNLTMGSNNEYFDAKSHPFSTESEPKVSEERNTSGSDQSRASKSTHDSKGSRNSKTSRDSKVSRSSKMSLVFNSNDASTTDNINNSNTTNNTTRSDQNNIKNTSADHTIASLHKTTDEDKNTKYSKRDTKGGLQIYVPSDENDPALYQDQSFKFSNTSLNSGELLTRLERSLSNWSQETNAKEIAYRPEGPKLVTINPFPLEQVHYHDSDISSDNSIGSIGVLKQNNYTPNYKNEARSANKNKYDNSRRPPPIAPGFDSLTKPHQHEMMLEDTPRTLIVGFPSVSSPIASEATSPIYSDYDSDNDKSNVFYEKEYHPTFKHKYFSWSYFFLFVIMGLLIPPVFLLLSLGSFDKIKRLHSNYSGVYYRQQLLIDNPRVVRFSKAQKITSLILGIIWFAIIIAMIGVGFGLS